MKYYVIIYYHDTNVIIFERYKDVISYINKMIDYYYGDNDFKYKIIYGREVSL